MLTQRMSSVLAHITSLPSTEGMGTLGAESRLFIDRLAEAGQSIWQILPLNPTLSDGSPYAALSSFAGAEHVISLLSLQEQGLLSAQELAPLAELDARRIEFAIALPLRREILAKASRRFVKTGNPQQRHALKQFCANSAHWLDDYSLFRAILEKEEWRDWTDWPVAIRDREPEALAKMAATLRQRIEEIKVEQFFFYKQWNELRAYAKAHQIGMFGDMPIYVAQTSADVWTHRHLFDLDGQGHPISVAGCPPDMMAAAGQRWGNPTYNWQAMQDDGFGWWVGRMRYMVDNYDWIRIDHFRAFASYWRIPASDPDASGGVWVPAPGHELFRKLRDEFGDVGIIAEDLGFVTPDVYELRDAFDFPGMHIIQYDLENEPLSEAELPINYQPNSVAYFGNHDNNTAMGWLEQQSKVATPKIDDASRPLLAQAMRASEPHWAFNELVFKSGSHLAVLQVQDILGLGARDRMNVPGTASGNWLWRFLWEDFRPEYWQRLRDLTQASGRLPERSTKLQDASAAESRAESGSGSSLDALLREIKVCFLDRQHPESGLLPAGPAFNVHGDYSHAWVRDNAYCVIAIWAASCACERAQRAQEAALYRDRARLLMKGLLRAMQGQRAKVDRFIASRSPADSLHAKYDARDGHPVSGDDDWGHLQLDATALFLLITADMSAANIQIIDRLEEWEFLKKLVTYISLAWCCGDFGVWERGDKRNIGLLERNMSSLGLAKAALQALPKVEFQIEGLADRLQLEPMDKALAVRFDDAQSALLPEESTSKEVDAGLLAICSYPGFAIDDPSKVEACRSAIATKLMGRYGAARFLLDGHQTVLETHSRLHYEPGELGRFSGIECEWPLFLAFNAIAAGMEGNKRLLADRLEHLRQLCVEKALADSSDRLTLLPELYYVPHDCVEAERAKPGSTIRQPNENIPLYWSQSLYCVARLLAADHIAPQDIDPLGRRLRATSIGPDKAERLAIRASQSPWHLLLGQGLYLRQSSGDWCHILTPHALEGRGFEDIDPNWLRELAAQLDPRADKYPRDLVGLDLRALQKIGMHQESARCVTLPELAARAQDVSGRGPELGWADWREHLGAVMPVGGDFARRVWHALARCRGIVFSQGGRLDSALMRSDHSDGERAFALQLLFLISQEPDLVSRAWVQELLWGFAHASLAHEGDLDLRKCLKDMRNLFPDAMSAPSETIQAYFMRDKLAV